MVVIDSIDSILMPFL